MDIEVRPLRDEERAAAGAVAGRALATSPTSYWVSGDPAVPRLHMSLDVFVGLVEGQTSPIGALIGDHIVGVAGASPPGACIKVTAPPEMQVMPESVGEVGDFTRAQYVWALFCGRDLEERHWHLGPVAVEPVLQGAGVGSLMMRAFSEQMDEAGEVGWLETDKPENVVFYRRAGWEVVEELTEHGLTCWFMRREPR